METSASEEEGRRHALGQRIERQRQALRITYEQLARKSGFDERTIRNIVRGQPCRPWTLLAVCEAVGLPVDETNPAPAAFADEAHGGYSRRSMERYVGRYHAFRRAAGRSDRIRNSVFEFAWLPERGCLGFRERQRQPDGACQVQELGQSGEVYANELAGLIHLLTIAQGMVRTITLTQLQPPELVMKGGVFTQARVHFYRRPSLSAIVLRKLPVGAPEVEVLAGDATPDLPGYAALAAALAEAERYVLLLTLGDEAAPRPQEPADGAYDTIARLSAPR